MGNRAIAELIEGNSGKQSVIEGPLTMLPIGNTSLARTLQRRLDEQGGKYAEATPTPIPAASVTRPKNAGPVSDIDEHAWTAAEAMKGALAGSFTYEDPMSPDFQPPAKPGKCDLNIAELIPRIGTEDNGSYVFATEGEARAFATMSRSATGMAVLSVQSRWAVARLRSVSAAEFERKNVYRMDTKNGVTAIIAGDGFLFTSRGYVPDADRAGKQMRAENEVATPVDAKELRAFAGMQQGAPQETTGDGKERKTPGTVVPKGSERSFVESYVRARALEVLAENRKMATQMAGDFKPGAGGKLSDNAIALISKGRAMGALYETIETEEGKIGKLAAEVAAKHRKKANPYGLITVQGRSLKYFAFVDEINATLATVQQGKQSALSLSPVLSSMVNHKPTATSFSGAAGDADWEHDKAVGMRVVSAGLDGAGAFIPGVSSAPLEASRVFADKVQKSFQVSPDWKDSELSKTQSVESDNKVAEQFRAKLDDVQRAISITYGRAVSEDIGFLLGMGGLRKRVDADFKRLGAENAEVKQAWSSMCTEHELKEAAIEVGKMVLQIGALFVPGGQFLSAAMGLGFQMQAMDKHLDQWDASKAAVDPAAALVDQQEIVSTLLFDSINLAISAVDMTVNLGGGLDAFEAAGKNPKDLQISGEATDTTNKHVSDQHIDPKAPDRVQVPGEPNKLGMSEEYVKSLESIGIPNGRPYGANRAAAIHDKCGKVWDKAKSVILHGAKNEADELAARYVMLQLIEHRQTQTESLLKKVITAMENEGKGRHTFEAVGSTKLASDLDYSITGPHAGEVLTRFNSEFRKVHGIESGLAFDTNLYTRSAHLDFSLAPLPGQGAVRMDAVAVKEWQTFSKDALAGVPEAQRANLKAVLKEAEMDFGVDLRARIRHVDNYRQQSVAHVRAYESAMSSPVDGPLKWKQYCETQLSAVAGSRRAVLERELQSAVMRSQAGADEVIAELNRIAPGSGYTKETLHELAHSSDPAKANLYLQARNNLYGQKAIDLDELKLSYEKATSEAEKLRIAGEINERQSQTLYFASEANHTGGSILGVVQNTQKAKGAIDSAHYGQMVSAQCRAGCNEQLGIALHYGSDWGGVTKAGKYVERAEAFLKAHPLRLEQSGMNVGGLRNAVSQLNDLKDLQPGSPRVAAWAKSHYPSASSVEEAFVLHRAQLSLAEKNIGKHMASLTEQTLKTISWERAAVDPALMEKALKALQIAAQTDGRN